MPSAIAKARVSSRAQAIWCSSARLGFTIFVDPVECFATALKPLAPGAFKDRFAVRSARSKIQGRGIGRGTISARRFPCFPVTLPDPALYLVCRSGKAGSDVRAGAALQDARPQQVVQMQDPHRAEVLLHHEDAGDPLLVHVTQ